VSEDGGSLSTVVVTLSGSVEETADDGAELSGGWLVVSG
jgi:hypothetical protein